MRRAWLLALLAGCPEPAPDPTVGLHALTKPPPASVATVITNHVDAVYEIELSHGVALAVACSQACEGAYGACLAPALDAGDPSLLDVRPLYRLNGTTADRVLIAKQVGTTTLRVESTCGAQVYRVRIVERGPDSE